jgi:hypothetical protein
MPLLHLKLETKLAVMLCSYFIQKHYGLTKRIHHHVVTPYMYFVIALITLRYGRSCLHALLQSFEITCAHSGHAVPNTPMEICSYQLIVH